MKTNRIAALAGLLSLILTGCATDKTEQKKPEAWGGAVVGQLKTKGVVQNVNYGTRQVTIKHDTGETVTVVCGPLVRNFNQIKNGDKVALEYQESVTILALSGVDTVPARAETVDIAGAPLGQKPSGMIVQTGEVLAEVVAINYQDRTVTLKGPVRTLTVTVNKEVKNFDRLKQGDKVYLRGTQALAVTVTAE